MPASRTHRVILLLMLIVTGTNFAQSSHRTLDRIPLDGTWRFGLDSEDIGIEEQWFDAELKDRIELPGVLQNQGYGNEISTETPWVMSLYDKFWYERRQFKKYTTEGEVKVPFLSQPPKHYLGAAWYQRDITIPEEWKDKRVFLKLERTRWKSTVWIDDKKIGSEDSLVAPHYFELGQVEPGEHTLTIRVDNRMIMDYRPDGHSVSDSMGSTWNGIVGDIELISKTGVWLEDVRVYGSFSTKSVAVNIQIGNVTGKAGTGTLEILNRHERYAGGFDWPKEGKSMQIEVKLGEDAEPWDEFNPVLHHITVNLTGDNANDTKDISFGLRRICTDGNSFLINGRKSQFRGALSNGDFPLTGYPPTDVEYWKKLFTTCRQWGLNHLRFHSFCPPEAAFTAADQVGIYLQPECGMWNAISPGTEMEKRMYDETDRMIREYGNHPSFMLFSPSNEPKGDWKPSLTKWVEHYRSVDPRRLYTTGTGWPLIEQPGHVEGADYLAVHRIGRRAIRGSRAWFGADYLRSVQWTDVPVIVHELGQWCAYPDYDVIKKFKGYLRPGNLEIYQDMMKNAGLADMDKEFAYASGKLQAACYKEDIEANMRTPGLAGFQLLDLNDYMGQGTALVGVLDAFWEEKGYIKAKQWRRFCNTTVPLAVLKKRVFTNDDSFETDIKISHYGIKELKDVRMYWKIADAKANIIEKGQWTVEKIPLGNGFKIGEVKADLSKLKSPAAYKFIVGIEGTEFENDWDIWVYPAKIETEPKENVIVTRSFSEAVKKLDEGMKVLLCPKPNELGWDSPPVGREPIFWNRLMGPSWERFLGMVCDKEHPALSRFPTEAYYDWQWTDVFGSRTRAVNLSGMPENLKPIVQVIDDWGRNYKLAAIFECRINKGKLTVCSADLVDNTEDRPAVMQLKKSLLDYMASEKFEPETEITIDQLEGIYYDNYLVWKLGAEAYADEEHGGRTANFAIDGNPNTCWNTAGWGEGQPYPHELTIRFPSPAKTDGLIIMNRQNDRDRLGDIKDYEIEISDEGNEWTLIKKDKLESTFDVQKIFFEKTVNAKYIKIRAISGFGNDKSSAIAEAGLIRAGTKTVESDREIKDGYTKTSSETTEMFETINPLDYSTNPSARYVEDIYADSEMQMFPPEFAMDGNENTFWHSQWQHTEPGHKRWIALSLKEKKKIYGIRYLPRQDMIHGRIIDYRVEISDDGKNWVKIAEGKFENSEQIQPVVFAEPAETEYIRLVAETETQNRNFAAIAEIELEIRD